VKHFLCHKATQKSSDCQGEDAVVAMAALGSDREQMIDRIRLFEEKKQHILRCQ
jgi:hypothetical protein